MSIRWISRAFETPCDSPAEKLLLVTLADYASKDTAAVFPRVRSIELKTGLTRRCVQLLLRKLERRGLLQQDGFTPGGVVRYRLMLGPLGIVSEEPKGSSKKAKTAKARPAPVSSQSEAEPAIRPSPQPAERAIAPSPPAPLPAPSALPAAAPETSRWDFLRLFTALGYSFQKNRDGLAGAQLAKKNPLDVRAALLLGHARKRRAGGKDMPRTLAYFLPIVAEVESQRIDAEYVAYLEHWVSDWAPFFRERERRVSEELALAS